MPELLAGVPGKKKRAECLPTRVKQAYMGLGTAWGWSPPLQGGYSGGFDFHKVHHR